MKKAIIKVFNLSGVEVFSAKVSETDTVNARDMAFNKLEKIIKDLDASWSAYKAVINYKLGTQKKQCVCYVDNTAFAGFYVARIRTI